MLFNASLPIQDLKGLVPIVFFMLVLVFYSANHGSSTCVINFFLEGNLSQVILKEGLLLLPP